MNNGQGKQRKYSAGFKVQLVAESREEGVGVSKVSKRHGVPCNRIYAWRVDDRFQGDTVPDQPFIPVSIEAEAALVGVAEHEMPHWAAKASPARKAEKPDRGALSTKTAPAPCIEITLENGRRLRVSAGIGAGFILELARGLAA